MAQETAVRRDGNLLKLAKKVFGSDLVKAAYVCTWYTEGVTSKAETRERLKSAKVEWSHDRLDYSGETIRLVFCNGRTVEFTNSEWASMWSPKTEGVEI